MYSIRTFWEFTRPHTIIGSFISVWALYVMAAGVLLPTDGVFWLSLLSALACNVAITGYNQVTDLELDQINKPHLPLPSGAMTMKAAKRTVFVSTFIAAGTAATVSWPFAGLIILILLLGLAYSYRGVYLKRHHSTAALAITLVRGVLVNVGFYLHFAEAGFRVGAIPGPIWLLVLFISLFSLGIAWFKDIPDTIGDMEKGVRTMVLARGATSTFQMGAYMVTTAYVLGAFIPLAFSFAAVSNPVLVIGHVLAGLAFVSTSLRVDLQQPESMKRFYKLFWVFFFVEYALFILAFQYA